MPNIYGQYTLTEAAKTLGVTAAWINRVQRETGIGGELGIKGQEAAFTEDHLFVFRRVKVLRLIDFSFRDIKEIFHIEDSIWTAEEYLRRNTKLCKNAKELPFILHRGKFCVLDISTSYEPGLDDISKKGVDDNKRLVEILYKIASEISRRYQEFKKAADEVTDMIKQIADEYPKLFSDGVFG